MAFEVFGLDLPHGVKRALHLFAKEVALVGRADLKQLVYLLHNVSHLLGRDGNQPAEDFLHTRPQGVL